MPLFDDADLTKAKEIADKNWTEWQEDFEYNGAYERLPVLQEPYRFCRFCRDYSLMRYADSNVVEKVRTLLFGRELFRSVVEDETGANLDALADDLPKRIPEVDAERSMLSKLAAFARPDKFIAYDRFARRGAHYFVNRSRYPQVALGALLRSPRKSAPYRTYVDYLRDVNTVSGSEAGDQVRNSVGADSRGNGFVLRVLDCCLMMVGNRWPS